MGSNKLIQGNNDLRTWCINNHALYFLDEWDKDKNGILSPDSISYASNRKVWWKCPKNHSYAARINNRVFNGNGCPYCSNHKVLKGFNDFETWCVSNKKEDLLSQWDYEKNDIEPSQVTPFSGKRVWWVCSLGHEWDSILNSRTRDTRPSGCPYCSNPPKRILVGFNDFETWCKNNHKEHLLEEWNVDRNGDISPDSITYGCGKPVWWKCNKGHEWRTSVANRSYGFGCPICARTQTSFPEQAIAFYLSKHYNVIQRYRVSGYEIDIYLEDYNIGIEYDGMRYHTNETADRESMKDSFYSNQGITLIHVKEDKEKNCIDGNTLYFVPRKFNYVDSSFNELLIKLMEHINELVGVSFEYDIDLIRDELHIREHYASELHKNSLAVLFPDLVSEWDVEKNNGLTPDHFSAYANTKVWWKCNKGHSWKAVISSRTGRKLGCPYCAGQRVISGENDLESWCKQNNPSLLDEWNYEKNEIKPSDVAVKSNIKVWWKCSKGHEWEALIPNRINGTKCPICFNENKQKRGVSLREWSILNNKNHLLDEWDCDKNKPLTPDSITHGSHAKVWWKCDKGHEWEAQVKSRTYNHGCPYCSSSNKRAVIGKNDLVTWCRENHKEYILDEWDYDSNDGLLPESFTHGSHKRIVWKCKKGHTWSAVIKERTKVNGNICPMCKKEKPSPKQDDG